MLLCCKISESGDEAAGYTSPALVEISSDFDSSDEDPEVNRDARATPAGGFAQKLAQIKAMEKDMGASLKDMQTEVQ